MSTSGSSFPTFLGPRGGGLGGTGSHPELPESAPPDRDCAAGQAGAGVPGSRNCRGMKQIVAGSSAVVQPRTSLGDDGLDRDRPDHALAPVDSALQSDWRILCQSSVRQRRRYQSRTRSASASQVIGSVVSRNDSRASPPGIGKCSQRSTNCRRKGSWLGRGPAKRPRPVAWPTLVLLTARQQVPACCWWAQ